MAASSGLFNLQPIATRGKKACSMLLVDQHCGNNCSIKRAPLSVSYYNEISGGHIGSCRCSEEGLCRSSTTPVATNALMLACMCVHVAAGCSKDGILSGGVNGRREWSAWQG